MQGTGDGGNETDEADDNKRAEARARSKGKANAADPESTKKRAAPAGANTSKAAKKNKTGVLASQVRSERHTVGANVERTAFQPTHRDPQNLIW